MNDLCDILPARTDHFSGSLENAHGKHVEGYGCDAKHLPAIVRERIKLAFFDGMLQIRKQKAREEKP